MKVRCRETAVFQPLYLKYSLRWMVQGDALVCVMLSCVWLSMLHVLGGDNVSHVFHTAVLLCGWPLCRLHVTWVTCAAEHYTSICSVQTDDSCHFCAERDTTGLCCPVKLSGVLSASFERTDKELLAHLEGAALHARPACRSSVQV